MERPEAENIKVGITIASTSSHQVESTFNNPLNLPEQHAINKTHMKKTSNIQCTPKKKQTHAKNPTMTPISTAPASTNDKQKNVIVEDSLEEQQKAIAYLKRKADQLEGKIFEMEDQIHIA